MNTQRVTIDELKKALLANEVEITDADLSAFDQLAADGLREDAAILREVAPRAHRCEWYVTRKLDSSAVLSIAENYEWAALRIETLLQVAARE